MDETPYVYFQLTGGELDPQIITDKLKINPTEVFRKGDKRKYNTTSEFSGWKLSADKGPDHLMIEELVEKIVSKLFDKIELINELKEYYGLNSVLEIVLFIDTNEEKSTPVLGHDLKTIEFLYRTQTRTDIDIYRVPSKSEK